MESDQPAGEQPGPRHGTLVFIGVPCVLQILAMYVLVAVETPLSPFVARLLERPIGIFVLAMIGFTFVCLTMWGVLTWAEHRNKRASAPSNRVALLLLAWSVAPLDTPTDERRAQSRVGPRTLVALLAHADDESPITPILSRYAREGVKVYLVIVSNGSEGAGSRGSVLQRSDSGPRGDDLVRARADEARCAASTLGAEPPILLGFPDGKLGDYIGDRTLMTRLTERVAQELARLRPDAIITWGPDGGTGHPDHRIVSNIATQLLRSGAPGVPERLFYMNFPAETFRAMYAQRVEPPFVVPQLKHFTFRVPFAPVDFDVAMRSMACHRSQFTAELIARLAPVQQKAWNGAIGLIPAFQSNGGTDVFR